MGIVKGEDGKEGDKGISFIWLGRHPNIDSALDKVSSITMSHGYDSLDTFYYCDNSTNKVRVFNWVDETEINIDDVSECLPRTSNTPTAPKTIVPKNIKVEKAFYKYRGATNTTKFSERVEMDDVTQMSYEILRDRLLMYHSDFLKSQFRVGTTDEIVNKLNEKNLENAFREYKQKLEAMHKWNVTKDVLGKLDRNNKNFIEHLREIPLLRLPFIKIKITALTKQALNSRLDQIKSDIYLKKYKQPDDWYIMSPLVFYFLFVPETYSRRVVQFNPENSKHFKYFKQGNNYNTMLVPASNIFNKSDIFRLDLPKFASDPTRGGGSKDSYTINYTM